MVTPITYKSLTIVPIPAEKIRRVGIAQLGGLTMGEWYARQTDRPDAMLNGSLWDNKGAIGTIWKDGQLQRNEGGGFGIGEAGSGWAFGEPWEQKWENYITGTPALIRGGKATGDHMPLERDEIARTRRSAICGAGLIFYMVTGKNLTLAEFTTQLQEFGMYQALNLDGGGSSRMMLDGVPINAPTDNRRCPNAVAVWLVKGSDKETEDKKEEEGESKMKSIYLSPSTQENNVGAGSYGTEERRMNEIMDLIENQLRGKYILYRNRPEMSLRQVVADSNAKNPDLHFALHSNAGGSRGTECWICAKGGQAEKFANLLYKKVAPLTPTKDRGVKVSSSLYEVNKTRAPATILEIDFHDNAQTAQWIIDNKTAVAHACVQAIMEFFGDAASVPEQPEEKPMEKWYEKELREAVAMGITDGTRPEDTATRAEAAIMVLRAVKAMKGGN